MRGTVWGGQGVEVVDLPLGLSSCGGPGKRPETGGPLITVCCPSLGTNVRASNDRLPCPVVGHAMHTRVTDTQAQGTRLCGIAAKDTDSALASTLLGRKRGRGGQAKNR